MDLVFVSMENWDEIWRRNQFVCAELARRFPQDKILFVGLARDISNQIRRGRLRGILSSGTSLVEGHPQITVTRPVKLLPNTIPAGRRINDLFMRRHVARAAFNLGMCAPVLWLNPHSAVHMAGRMGECASVYDITDDWISLTQSDALKRLTAEQDGEMCGKVDAVIVCSQRLYELKQGLAHNLHLIPNGVDADHYSSVQNGGGVPQATERWQRPVLGYTGTIHRDRVDLALVEQIARRLTEGCIALVGPSHLVESESARLEATGRVHFTGGVPYARVPDYMRAFDVCITPHLVTDFTESLNPIKLWEYLASGKPIVSTPVAGFRDFPAYVRIATTCEEFVSLATAALEEGPEAGAERIAEAQKHSWHTRVDAIVEVVDRAIARRRV